MQCNLIILVHIHEIAAEQFPLDAQRKVLLSYLSCGSRWVVGWIAGGSFMPQFVAVLSIGNCNRFWCFSLYFSVKIFELAEYLAAHCCHGCPSTGCLLRTRRPHSHVTDWLTGMGICVPLCWYYSCMPVTWRNSHLKLHSLQVYNLSLSLSLCSSFYSWSCI